MNFIDFHCDTASLLLEFQDKNLRSSDLKVDIEKLQKGNAAAQFFALFIHEDKKETLYNKCVRMLDNLKKEMELNKNEIMLCRNFSDYTEARKLEKIAGFITIEEGEAIEGDMDKLRFFKEQGVSLMTLTWNYENHIGYPNYQYKNQFSGLKPFGIEVVEEMNRLGMLIDVSHLSDRGFWDVINHSKYPIIASHSNARVAWDHSRNLTDEMIKTLSDKGGVTGINFCNNFLGNSEVSSIADMVRHIKHIKNIGGIDCIALGSDFDGIENEVEIKDASEMGNLIFALEKEGFTQNEIEKIFFKNGERIIKDVLK